MVCNEGAKYPPVGAENPLRGAENPPKEAENSPGESLDSSMNTSQKNGGYDSLEIFSPTTPPHHSTPTHPPTHSPSYASITELQPLAVEDTASSKDSPKLLKIGTFV